ncbi:MAG: FAD binding domain-containing protein [Ilumatobacteraceae bacterium]
MSTGDVLLASTVDEAVEALAARPESLVLAGGTDVMVELNERRRRAPVAVIAVDRLAELASWSHDPRANTVTIGAGVRWREIERGPLGTLVPALAQAARTVGSPQIRQAGTVGGNLGTCSPAGDGLPPLAALDAVVHLRSTAGQRDLSFADFMVGPKRSARRPDELVTGVTVPAADGWQGYAKVGVRNAMVISIASAALVHHRPSSSVRIALGSVGPVILRCSEAEGYLAEQVDLSIARPVVTESEAERAAELVRAAARPIDDHRSTAEYRRHAVGVLAARLLRGAFDHA